MTSAFRFLGLSSDWRANRWSLTLPCGHTNEPADTMLNVQHVQCKICRKTYVVSYNEQTIEEDE